MSLAKNVLLKESFAQERRRRSNVESETDGMISSDIHSPKQAAENDSVFKLETDDPFGKMYASDDRPLIEEMGKENSRQNSTSQYVPSVVKRRRTFCDKPHLGRPRDRSSSLSSIENGIVGGVKREPVRKWTKVEDEWIPIGGVRKKIPGGLKDRLLKMQEKRTRVGMKRKQSTDRPDQQSWQQRLHC